MDAGTKPQKVALAREMCIEVVRLESRHRVGQARMNRIVHVPIAIFGRDIGFIYVIDHIRFSRLLQNDLLLKSTLQPPKAVASPVYRMRGA